MKYSKSTHNYSTRVSAKDNLVIPQVKTNIGKKTLKYAGAVIWNELSTELRRKSVAGLKYSYKKFLISNY